MPWERLVLPKYRRVGECNRLYACARLNCCGDCEHLTEDNGIGVCLSWDSDWDCGGKKTPDGPTVEHWLQQTYWRRGEPRCSFWFEEAEDAV